MGMRGKREAGSRGESGLPQGTEKEELRVTGSPIGSGILRKTESVWRTVLSRKAMNLNETEDAPSSERRILGGIGESRRADSESGRISTLSFPRRRESRKSDESGRSMVETLGVLAIMGVLAIGGIMAYRYAVTKYQANETFNELRRRVIVHSQQSIIGTPLSQVEIGDTTQLGYPIDVMPVDKSFFELTLQDIDKDLCREMVRTGWTLPTQTRVNGVVVGTNPEACGEENVLVFRFQTEMGGCKTDDDCPCGTCENGTCRTSCAGGESCVKDFNDGQYICCPGGSVKGQFCCETVNEAGECCDADGNCCPPEKPIISGNKCVACSGHFAVSDWQMCDKCDGTHQAYYSYGSYRCGPKCPADKIMGSDGQCHGCDDAPFDIWIGRRDETLFFAESCGRICPNRQITQTQRDWGYPFACGIKCTEPDTFMDGYGNCQPCLSEDVVKASQTECHTCGNRMLAYGDWCHRCDLIDKDPYTAQAWCLRCPNLVAGYGCHICDSPEESIWMGWMSQDNNQKIINTCLQCGNRYYDGYWYSGNCIRCPEDLSTLTPEQQAQCGG